MIKRRRGAIPRKTVLGRHVTDSVDKFGRPDASLAIYEEFSVLNTTVQAYVGDDLVVQQDGFQSKEAYTLFTETKLTDGEEDSLIKPDEVFVFDSWCRVVKVKARTVGIIPHYECVVVRSTGGLI